MPARRTDRHGWDGPKATHNPSVAGSIPAWPTCWAFAIHLQGANRSNATIAAYQNDARRFASWLTTRRPEAAIVDATRSDIEGFLADGRSRGPAAATVARRYRSLRQLYRWLAREDEVPVSPMAEMRPPAVPVQPVPIIPDDDMAALLAASEGKRFEDRRDRAMVLMLATTGVRAGEIMGLAVEDVDLKRGIFTVTGKGRRLRLVELLPKTAEALDRYLRVRRSHPAHRLPDLWLGAKGRLSTSGLAQMLERRCVSAGIKPINPHRFRHTFAHKA